MPVILVEVTLKNKQKMSFNLAQVVSIEPSLNEENVSIVTTTAISDGESNWYHVLESYEKLMRRIRLFQLPSARVASEVTNITIQPSTGMGAMPMDVGEIAKAVTADLRKATLRSGR